MLHVSLINVYATWVCPGQGPGATVPSKTPGTKRKTISATMTGCGSIGHPTPNVMADLFRHKNQYDVLIQCLCDLVYK